MPNSDARGAPPDHRVRSIFFAKYVEISFFPFSMRTIKHHWEKIWNHSAGSFYHRYNYNYKLLSFRRAASNHSYLTQQTCIYFNGPAPSDTVPTDANRNQAIIHRRHSAGVISRCLKIDGEQKGLNFTKWNYATFCPRKSKFVRCNGYQYRLRRPMLITSTVIDKQPVPKRNCLNQSETTSAIPLQPLLHPPPRNVLLSCSKSRGYCYSILSLSLSLFLSVPFSSSSLFFAAGLF